MPVNQPTSLRSIYTLQTVGIIIVQPKDTVDKRKQERKNKNLGNSAGDLFGMMKNVTLSKIVGDLQPGDSKGVTT